MYSEIGEFVFQWKTYFLPPWSAIPPPRATRRHPGCHCLGHRTGHRCLQAPPCRTRRRLRAPPCRCHPCRHRPSPVLLWVRKPQNGFISSSSSLWWSRPVLLSTGAPPHHLPLWWPSPSRRSLVVLRQTSHHQAKVSSTVLSPSATTGATPLPRRHVAPPGMTPLPPKHFGRSPFLNHEGNKTKNRWPIGALVGGVWMCYSSISCPILSFRLFFGHSLMSQTWMWKRDEDTRDGVRPCLVQL
jgi:hypothetical protein